MKVCVLGSSSRGNAILVSSGGTDLLVDTGLSMRRTVENLRTVDKDMESVEAVLVTHCHVDHVRSLSRTGRGKKVVSTPGTLHVLKEVLENSNAKRTPVDYNKVVNIGDISVQPFAVPHDCAGQPSGFVLDDGRDRVAIAMDLGVVTKEVIRNLKGCTGLVIESNHDAELLFKSRRPAWLVNRILGPKGHLSNAECAEALESALDGSTDWVMLTHLSQECNTPEMAIGETQGIVEERGATLKIAHPTLPTNMKEGVGNEGP